MAGSTVIDYLFFVLFSAIALFVSFIINIFVVAVFAKVRTQTLSQDW